MSGKEMTNDELPEGWINCHLGDAIGYMRNGMVAKQTKDGSGLPISRIETIAAGTIDPNRIGFSNDVSAKNAESYRLKSGDILFSHINSPSHLGKTAIYEGYPETLYHGMNLLMLQAREGLATPRFLEASLRFLRVSGTFSLVAQHAVNQASINQKKLSELQIPLAPLPEQKRIADKLDALLGRVDACRVRLDRVPALLKRFRQSVLAAAVSGKLTEEWSERHDSVIEAAKSLADIESTKKGKLRVQKSDANLDALDLFEIPSKWSWVKNHQLAVDSNTAICAGPFGTIFKAKDFRDSGVPIIFLRHVAEGQYLTRKPGFMDKAVWKAQHQEYSVHGGELLVTKLGDPPGTACIYPEGIGVAMVTPDVMKMDVDQRVADPLYLMYFFNSPLCKDLVTQMAFGATRLRIDLTMFKNFPIPLPPRAEQQEIVRRVEALFAFADRIEARLASAQKTVERLTPATLAKAFRGELVPQDPNDEPASALLERLKSAAPEPSSKKQRRSKGAAT